jgi:parvulin-like peptidyl-prolyl isomerase
VILVQFRGAQLAPENAPYKTDALQRARTLAELARKDFKAAVKQGDPGSQEDVGRVGRNILEPPLEYELFTLAPGGVSDPIDTPRGYWIARRID